MPGTMRKFRTVRKKSRIRADIQVAPKNDVGHRANNQKDDDVLILRRLLCQGTKYTKSVVAHIFSRVRDEKRCAQIQQKKGFSTGKGTGKGKESFLIYCSAS